MKTFPVCSVWYRFIYLVFIHINLFIGLITNVVMNHHRQLEIRSVDLMKMGWDEALRCLHVESLVSLEVSQLACTGLTGSPHLQCVTEEPIRLIWFDDSVQFLTSGGSIRLNKGEDPILIYSRVFWCLLHSDHSGDLTHFDIFKAATKDFIKCFRSIV